MVGALVADVPALQDPIRREVERRELAVTR